ncbi:hypothetical protein DUI87_07752 [Hirundo rustica rustica]|uniref:Uncharacterized protein n=1 Tax=Hirundo rustica rustica TaxID=333673 RepID=A0A3M0KRE7_HIRRU|nr:hypothetical protein DUI87_07752 [Hirundo rustica rustica]
MCWSSDSPAACGVDHVEAAVSLQLVEIHGEAEIQLQPMEKLHAVAGGCPVEAVTLCETCGQRGPAPRLEQPVLRGLHPVEE